MNLDTEMRDHFLKRTNYHISLVNKYLEKIAGFNLPEVNNLILIQDSHDRSKFEEPEYTPYLHVNWKNKLKDEGKIYSPPKDIEEVMYLATYHHVKGNSHHPEFWDESTTLESINPKDRNGIPEKIVDGTKMPFTALAQMIADWTAMAEEKKTLNAQGRYSAKDWADKNVNVRWRFNLDQVEFIYRVIELL